MPFQHFRGTVSVEQKTLQMQLSGGFLKIAVLKYMRKLTRNYRREVLC